MSRILVIDESNDFCTALSDRIQANSSHKVVIAPLKNGKVDFSFFSQVSQISTIIISYRFLIGTMSSVVEALHQAFPKAPVIMTVSPIFDFEQALHASRKFGIHDAFVRHTRIESLSIVDWNQILDKINESISEYERQISAAHKSTVHKPKQTFNLLPIKYGFYPDALAIGSSTGGPHALFSVMAHLKNLPCPIFITQHMPTKFTKIMAEQITNHSGILCEEVNGTGVALPGQAYIAPGGKHMIIKRLPNNKLSYALDDGPPENFCKPSVDPMLRSLAKAATKPVVAILTGMGKDGLGGCKNIVESDGIVIAQDEETSVVWGMPGAVAMAGIASKVLPLEEIGPFLYKLCTGGRP